MNRAALYEAFSAYVTTHPSGSHSDAIRAIMLASGGSADPNVISEWFSQWALLRVDLFKAGWIFHSAQMERERKSLQREVEILRQYGNKDCTAMADERLWGDNLETGG